jgi:Protein of unknown function (DUF4240)
VEAAKVAGDVDCQAQGGRLTAKLELLAPEEIVSFAPHFSRRMAEGYRWDLWGLAYQFNGGCSDDGFVYFRCWLLAAGCWRRGGPPGRRRCATPTRWPTIPELLVGAGS